MLLFISISMSPKGSRNCREAPLNLKFLLNLAIAWLPGTVNFENTDLTAYPQYFHVHTLYFGEPNAKSSLNMYSIFSLLYLFHNVPICMKYLPTSSIPSWILTAPPLNWFLNFLTQNIHKYIKENVKSFIALVFHVIKIEYSFYIY